MAVGYSDGSLIVDTGMNNAGFFRDAKQFKSAVESLKNTVNRVGQDMAKSGNAYGQSLRESAQAARELDRQIGELRRRQVEAVREMNAIQKAGGDRNRYDALSEAAKSLAARVKELSGARQALGGVGQGMEQVADNAGSAARAVESVGRQTGGAAARLAKLAAGGVLGFLRKLASGAKNAAIQLAKLSGRALASGIKAIGSAASRAGKALFGLGKRARQSNGGIQLSLRNILRYGLGIRSLFVLFNRLRSAIKEGFDTLANYDPRVKAALASLKGALNGLKGSLAGAFAPILTAIAPALTTFINLLATAINTIGMFMAALTGQGYYMAAKGIEAVDSAAGGASGSVKELKRQLAGFDELNILSAGTSGGGSAGGGSAGAGYGYDRIPIEGGIADFVQRMKLLFAAGEYEEIGAIIADGINGAFQRVQDFIRWENIGGTLTGYVDAFAGIFNGMVGRIKWKDIGKTFGDGLNTIVNTLGRWYKKLDFKNVGTAIGEALNGMVERVNFAKAGATLASMLTAKLVVAANALATFDWEKFGPKLAEGFNSFIGKLDEVLDGIDWPDMARRMVRGLNGFIRHVEWRDAGETLGKRLNEALDMLYAAVTEFEWGEAGTAFSTTVNSLLSIVKWETLTKAFGTSINGVISALTTAVTGFKWDEAGRTFALNVNLLLTTVNWTSLGKALGASISGAIEWLKNVVKEFKWEDAGTAFANVVNGLKNAVKWDDLGETLGNLLKGAMAFMKKAIRDFDWAGMGESFREFILHDIDWEGIGAAAVELFFAGFKGALSFLLGALIGKDNVDQMANDWNTGIEQRAQEIKDSGRTNMSLTANDLIVETAEDVLIDDTKKTYTQEEIDEMPTLGEFLWKSIFPGASAESAYQYKADKDPFSSSYSGPTSEHVDWTFGEQTVDVSVNLVPADNKKPAYANGGLLKYLQTIFDPGTDEETRIQLLRDGWETVSGWVQTLRGAASVSQNVGLVRYLWQTVSGWVNGLKGNTKVEQTVGLITAAWSTVSAWVNSLKGNAKVQQAVDLVKGWYGSAKSYLGLDNLDTTAWVDATTSWWESRQSPLKYFGLENLTATVNVVANTTSAQNSINAVTNFSKSYKKAAKGGIITAGGVMRAFAAGGMVTAGGRARWWNSLPKYAGGTSRAHGTLFAAGEAGPEIVGHIGGRTEVLNQSQLAQTMRGAVTGGMIAALRGIEFKLPAMATGSVVPYDVSAQIAKSSAELQSTLDANNEDLIQTIISVIGAQTTAIVAALQAQQRNGGGAGGLNVQQVINEINRRTQMFAASPLSGG